MNAPHTDILVVGAGPTGLVLASELGRRGVSCRLIDIARGPTDRSKAIGVQARTMELFESMGIASEFIARGHKGRAANIYDGARRLARISFDGLESSFPYVLLLPQSDTERILLEHLEGVGVRVEREVKLTGFSQDGDGVTATLLHPEGRTEEVRTSWLVGCDGAHSTVRHTLGLPFEGEEYEEGFQLADIRLDWSLPSDELYVFIHDGWLLVLLPLPEGRCRLIADVPPEQAPPDRTPSLEECQALVDERCPVPATVSDPLWTANYRIHRRIVPRLRAGRAFLVGDAAHIHSPAAAQGMNTGIQDAFNLAWKLALTAQGASPEWLLDTYQAERYPVEQGVLRGTDRLLRIVSLRNPVAQAARDTLMPLLSGLGAVQERARANIAELAVHYPHSQIVEEHRFGHGPAAGERAPYAALPLTGQDTRHTLLLFSGPAPTPGDRAALDDLAAQVRREYGQHVRPRQVWAQAADTPDSEAVSDSDGALHTRYGADASCLYLIRPDGYIGYRSRVADRDSLLSYLARLFP